MAERGNRAVSRGADRDLTSPAPDRENTGADGGLVGGIVAGKYRVLELLGRGGFGEVYLVEFATGMIGQKLALKVLSPECSAKAESRERFYSEIRLAMKVVDRYIVQIRDVGTTADGRLYYTMDHCPGATLASILKRKGRLRIPESIWIIMRVLRAILSAHRSGIVHRDLKPSNIMVFSLDGKNTLRVLDFGIARAMGATRPGGERRIGTPAYMSPEQLTGGQIGVPSDLYSVGAILYLCVTGQKPYPGKTFRQVLDRMSAGPPIGPGEFTPEVARYPGLPELMLRALEHRPEDRFQEADEFLKAVREVAEKRSESTSPGAAGRPGQEVSEPPPGGRPRAAISGRRRSVRRSRWQRGRRNERLALLALAVGILFLGILFQKPLRKLLGLLDTRDDSRQVASSPAAPAVEESPVAVLGHSEVPTGREATLPPATPGIPPEPETPDAATAKAPVLVTPTPDTTRAKVPTPEPPSPEAPEVVAPPIDEVGGDGEDVVSVGETDRDGVESDVARTEIQADAEESVSLRLLRYADQLESLQVARERVTEGGLTVEVVVVADAYWHRMASAIRELMKIGYDDEALLAKLRPLHRQHRTKKNRPLLQVTITTSSSYHYFVQPKPGLLELRRRTRKTFSVLPGSDRPVFQVWEVYQYPPNKRRRYERRPLSKFTRLGMNLVPSSLDLARKEPFTLTVMNVVRQGETGNPKNGINLLERQISCVHWNDLIVPSATVTFFPGRWEIPGPPQGFEKLLDGR